MNDVRRIALALLGAALALGSGCVGSGGDKTAPERSTESFCSAWLNVVESFGKGARPSDVSEKGSPDLFRDLAMRSPEEALTEALNVMVDLQPRWSEQARRMQDGEIRDVDEFDADLNNRFVGAVRTFLDGVGKLCH